MAKDEFDIGQMIGGLGAGIESLKNMMTAQHGALSARLDIAMNGQKETDKTVSFIEKKVDAANYRLDEIIKPDGEIMRGIKYAHNYNENKKKVSFLMSVVLSLGAALGWLANHLFR